MARAHPRKAWAALKAAYRRGEGSYRELGERFGIPEQTIRKRAAREKWTVERNEVAAAAEQRAVERDTESLAAMLQKHRGFANRLLALSMKRVDQAVAEGKVSANLIDTMAGVLARVARQERLAAGIEPAKPVMAFETAGAGAVLRVVRKRNPAVPEMSAAAPVKALPSGPT